MTRVLQLDRDAFPDLVQIRCGDDTKTYRPVNGIQDSHADRESLLRYMEAWSEEQYAAGWLTDLEYVIARADEPMFRVMVERCGGWWTWADAERDEHGTLGRWRKWVDGTWDELRLKASR